MSTSTANFDASIAFSVYNGRLIAFSIAAITAFVMSAYFVVGYLVGDIKFWSWNEDQWLNALPGIGICAAMTAFQIVLYSKHAAAATAGTVLAIFIAAGFSVLSEIGQGMERDDIRMTTKSKESGAYQAVLGSIAGAAGSTYNPYSRDLQQANSRLATCQKKLAQGIYTDCAESEARVQAVKEMIAMSNAAQAQRALALSATAKTMERDENNYHPLVNLIRTSLGLTGIVASFLLSLTIIIFFEYAFHYLGRQLAEARDFLRNNGYDTTTRARRTPRLYNGGQTPENTVGTVQGTPKDTSDAVRKGTPKKMDSTVFDAIYEAIEKKVINGEINPTVRPVTNAVNDVIKANYQSLNIDPKETTKPQRQAIATEILELMETYKVIVRNTEGGVGKPKYVLADS